MITNMSIFILPGLRNITLSYTITPIGVGGNFFNVTLLGLDKLNLQFFFNIFKFKFDPDPNFKPQNAFLHFL